MLYAYNIGSQTFRNIPVLFYFGRILSEYQTISHNRIYQPWGLYHFQDMVVFWNRYGTTKALVWDHTYHWKVALCTHATYWVCSMSTWLNLDLMSPIVLRQHHWCSIRRIGGNYYTENSSCMHERMENFSLAKQSVSDCCSTTFGDKCLGKQSLKNRTDHIIADPVFKRSGKNNVRRSIWVFG